MGPEGDDGRRATASFARLDAAGQVVEDGHGAALIDDERLSVGPLVVAHLDADALRIADHRLEPLRRRAAT